MKELGLSRHIRVVLAPQKARDIQVTARHLLQSRQRPEAIFCWTDFVAMEVLSVARELGLSVPEDLALVGYDNTSYCDLVAKCADQHRPVRPGARPAGRATADRKDQGEGGRRAFRHHAAPGRAREFKCEE